MAECVFYAVFRPLAAKRKAVIQACPKKSLDFFDKDMHQRFEFERFFSITQFQVTGKR